MIQTVTDMISALEPEPQTARSLLRKTKTVLPPPSGRSPVKTNIGSSPRRHSSLAPRQQPPRSARTVARRLDFEADVPRPSIESSPRRTTNIPTPPAENDNLRPTPPPPIWDAAAVQHMIGDVGAEIGLDDYEAVIDESIAILNGDSVNGVSLLDLEPIPAPVVEKKKPKRKSRTSLAPLAPVPVQLDEYQAVVNETAEFLNRHMPPKGRRVPEPVDDAPNGVHDEGDVTEANIPIRPGKKPQKPKKATSRAAKPRQRNSDSVPVVDEDSSLAEVALPEAEYEISARPNSTRPALQPHSRKPPPKTKPNTKQPRKRAKPARPAADDDTDTDTEDAIDRPRKRSRNTASESRSKSPPRAEQRARSSSSSDRQQNPLAPTNMRRNRPTHTLQILQLRTSEPSADGGSHVTRSGRRIVKPLAHWRGETVEHAHDGTIRNVVRAESIEVEARGAAAGQEARDARAGRKATGGDTGGRRGGGRTRGRGRELAVAAGGRDGARRGPHVGPGGGGGRSGRVRTG